MPCTVVFCRGGSVPPRLSYVVHRVNKWWKEAVPTTVSTARSRPRTRTPQVETGRTTATPCLYLCIYCTSLKPQK